MQKESPIREPLILGDKSYHDITIDVAKPVLAKANKMWWIVFGISLILFCLVDFVRRLYYWYRNRCLGIK